MQRKWDVKLRDSSNNHERVAKNVTHCFTTWTLMLATIVLLKLSHSLLFLLCNNPIKKTREKKKHAKIVKDFSEQVLTATLKSKHVFIPLSLRLVFSGRIFSTFWLLYMCALAYHSFKLLLMMVPLFLTYPNQVCAIFVVRAIHVFSMHQCMCVWFWLPRAT